MEDGVEAAARAGHPQAVAVLALESPQWMGGGEQHLRGAEGQSPGPQNPEDRLLAILNAPREILAQMERDYQCERHDDSEERVRILPLFGGGWDEQLERRSDFYCCIRILQRIGDLFCAGDYCVSADNDTVFPGFSSHDLAILDITLRRAEEEMGRLVSDRRQTTGDDDDQGSTSVTVRKNLSLVVPARATRILEGMTQNRWIWEAFDQLTRAAREGRPKLRKCQMPRGLTGHIDHLLGRRKKPVPKCGTFYIARKDASTCGRARCQKAYRRLRDEHEVELAKKNRASELAWRNRED